MSAAKLELGLQRKLTIEPWMVELAQSGFPVPQEKNLQAMAGLAGIYSQRAGHGERFGDVAENLRQSVRWYTAAADAGWPPAQFLLGLNYSMGKGVTSNNKTAAKWWQKAADRGFGGAATLNPVVTQRLKAPGFNP
jgi:TPR repeat protein